MLQNIDHVTIVVTDLDDAISFFSLLGFEVDITTVIQGEVASAYMRVPNLDADHITLVLPGSSPRQEIQLLRYRRPRVKVDANASVLTRTGFNHVCFATDDLDGMIDKLTANGVELVNEPMVFNSRKLVFFRGPSGVTLELAQWLEA
jgi:catechol 2,3-dioxygenase-like lactoylglutathione lyase family enzyme